jgi:hypothetical protein
MSQFAFVAESLNFLFLNRYNPADKQKFPSPGTQYTPGNRENRFPR